MLLGPYLSPQFQLRNRVVMAPMTRSRADNEKALATDLMVQYYRQRATAGLIISEGINVSPRSVGYVNVPQIQTAEQTASWKKVTRGVQEGGGKIFAQLWHVGRVSHPDLLGGQLPLAPSALNPHSQTYTYAGFRPRVSPQAMSVEDIQTTIADFQNAAANALAAGFDGIEIHAANGYLFQQFFAQSANVRSDAYGGSLKNRCRFLFEALEAITQVIPAAKVGVRISPDYRGRNGIELDDETTPLFEFIATRLNDYNLAYLHLGGYHPPGEPGLLASIRRTAQHYRKFYRGTYIINRAFTQALAEAAISEGIADLVAFGELFISNPDLVARFAQHAPLQPADHSTYYTTGERGYTDYPFWKGGDHPE